ncbi:exonuclease [Nitzschia inconspicua]|uniref:Exonuclease n=1 Tax=Nitzschia inconspicua TaxID=303405 RepID=A0A9K3L1I2_9STRA|nr:exonuclease [Nitzschia inconspicua]
MSQQPPKRRKCGACKGVGHDRRNCPALRATKANNLAIPAVENRNGLDGGPSRLPIGATMPEIIPNINWDKVCYVLFDLETTGGSRTKDDIIELAAMVLGPDGIAIEDGSFESLIRPHRKITPYITTLTGITNEMVKTAPTFPEVMNSFFRFVGGIVQSHCILSSTIVDAIVLVAHNGRAFDIPFLLRSLQGHNLQSLLADDPRYGYFIDTLHVARTFLGDWTQRLPWTDGINNISVDKSPSNLNTFKHPDVPQLAHKLLPNAKVVVTLCKPDTRIYSEFQYHMVPKRHQHLVDQFEPYGRIVPDNFVDFAEANLRCLEEAKRNYDNAKEDVRYYCEILLNDYVRIGEYVRHLQPWYELYGEGNVLVVDMEQDAKSKVAALLSHIGEDLVPSEEYPWQELEDDGENNEEFFTNKAYEGRDSVFLKHPYIMQKLEDHYAPFNEALAAMIGADFPLNWNNRTS